MKDLLFLKGISQYDAMVTYVDEMADACMQLGYNVFCIEGEGALFQQRLDNVLEQHKFDAVITCNGIFLDWKEEMKKIRENIPLYITYLCDHPASLSQRLQYADDHTVVFVCDAQHKAYIDQYMPFVKHSCFVPLAGSYVKDQIGYARRRRNVVFTGTYTDPVKFREEQCRRFEGGMQQFIDFMLDFIVQNPSFSGEEVLKMGLQEFGLALDRNQVHDLMVEIVMPQVDAYARIFYRDAVMRELIENGIRVEVFGNGWENFEVRHKENLIINDGNTYTALKAVADAKISLNVMPWFKAGFQERIATAMMSGAVALTDGSKYISEHLQNGKQLVVYDLNKLEELPKIVREILQSPERGAQIAEQGQKYAINHARWIHRVAQMLTFINEIWADNDVKTEPGKWLQIYMHPGKNIREKSLEYMKKLEKLEQMIYEVNEKDTIRQGDYEYFKQKLERMLNPLAMELPEIEIIEPETAGQTGMLVLEEKSILEQLYRRENNEIKAQLCAVMEQQKQNKSVPFEKYAEVKRREMKILCKRILDRYGNDQEKELREICCNIKKDGLVDAYNQNFVEKYLDRPAESYGQILRDEEVGMYYVLVEGKRIYYPKDYDAGAVFASYRFICIEQDSESPHLYLDEKFDVDEGDVVVDAGVAEGNFSLAVIEKAKKIYLIECEHKWVEALRKTFEPWKEKVVIVEKMLSNVNDDKRITIDELVGENEVNFIKMDIEGAELDALEGAKNTLKSNDHIKCALCAYHRSNAEMMEKKILLANGFDVNTTKGYMFFKEDEESWLNAELRRGIVRGVKNID